MREEEESYSHLTIAVIAICIVCAISIPVSTLILNKVKKVNDKVDYDTQKYVEDTCRSMVSSYKADVLLYETYKDSDDKEEQSWAKAAKVRANSTAVTYNEYILKNSFIWEDNIPDDIMKELPEVE